MGPSLANPAIARVAPERVVLVDEASYRVILCVYRIAPGYSVYMAELWLPGFEHRPVRALLTPDEWRGVAEALGTVDCLLQLGQ